CGVRLQVERPRGTAGPYVGEGEDLEHRTRPEPEGEPASVAAEGWRKANTAPPAASEEVDDGHEERQEHREQDELDRPAADEPAAQIEIARRVPRKLDAIERDEERL